MISGDILRLLHSVTFAVWLTAGVATFVVTAAIKNAALPFPTRQARTRGSRYLQILPRICFALILPLGLELTRLGNIYPLDPELRIGFWIGATFWLVVLLLRLRYETGGLEKTVGYAEIAFQALAGMGFVVYGLNSLATGAPIDDSWFAAKLFLVGVALWTLIAIDLNFRSLAWPLEEIELDGSAPENEEALRRGVDHTLASMVILYMLVAATGFLGGGMVR